MRTSPRRATRHVVLLGLMGSGKTSVGALLADRLGWPLDDSDQSIERACGAEVRELNDRLGTERMHALEAEHLRHALSAETPSVVAAAASVIDDPECRAELTGEEVTAVWLDVPVERLAQRFAERDHRPSFGEDPRELLERQRRERAPFFRQVCRIHLEVTDADPEQTAASILSRLPGAGG